MTWEPTYGDFLLVLKGFPQETQTHIVALPHWLYQALLSGPLCLFKLMHNWYVAAVARVWLLTVNSGATLRVHFMGEKNGGSTFTMGTQE